MQTEKVDRKQKRWTEKVDRKLMKVIFLDFDGVMATAHYDNYLNYMGLPENDKYGVVFDPDCIANLKRIIDATEADIVVSSTWKDFMTYREIL